MSDIFLHLDSIAEYAALRSSPVNVNKGKHDDGGGSSWFGVPTYREADAICRSGSWPAGLARMERELGGFEAPAATSTKRRSEWSDQGDALDIHRVYAGNLDRAWRRTARRAVRSSRNLVIIFPLSIPARGSADMLFWRGAAALKLTDLLTVAGYTVTLMGTEGTRGHGVLGGPRAGHTSLIVKAAEAPLDVQSLIVAVAFPGFSRTVGFEATRSYPFEVSHGLGETIYDDRACIDALGLPHANVIDGLFTQVHDRDTARAWIAARVAALEADQQAA